MMLRYGLLVLVLVACLTPGGVAAPDLLNVKASLTGVVLADGIVAPGADVADGEPLVYVRTATEPRAVAATAPRDGTVREVLVKPGQRIERGAVIIRLEPK